ncbi:hypothetical protein TruAng_011676 [Truncatella angustata]|nr:hypothetical protein TruAng_011676 [Truncatella angustata]
MLADPTITALGFDPDHRSCILNGTAFQQDAITTFGGWQYACYYASLSHVSADPLDYEQIVDDGHNTVQVRNLMLGICPGDGTIHLSYDHHCDRLRYRYSLVRIAICPEEFEWDAKYFSSTVDSLPGLSGPHGLLEYISYPRFGPLERDLWFSFRTGKAGLGDELLCVYTAVAGTWTLRGTVLKGIQNSPYVHGLEYRNSRLFVTWVYRAFVWYEGWDDIYDVKHKQQRGPNAATNNHDICFAYSDDDGIMWKNGGNEQIADLSWGESISPASPGIVAFNIPKNSGLSNQESQAVDHRGGIHVLNRDQMDGAQKWKHYYRSPDGQWAQRALPHVSGVYGGKRGCLAVSKDDDLYLILPDNDALQLTILRASRASGYASYDIIWKGEKFPPTEPLVDRARLDYDNILSVFTRASVDENSDLKSVVVLDFHL